MKKIISMSLLMLLISLLLPIAMAKPRKNTPPTPPPLRESEPAETQATTPPPLGGQADSNTVFTALVDGVLREEVMEQYLPGAIAGEMPVAFEVEALKAQAVAARTYILYRMAHTNSKHPEADVCGDSGCCKAYVNEETLREKWGDAFEDSWEKMKNAVLETDGQYLAYGGEAIVAVFHSSSASRTEDSKISGFPCRISYLWTALKPPEMCRILSLRLRFPPRISDRLYSCCTRTHILMALPYCGSAKQNITRAVGLRV